MIDIRVSVDDCSVDMTTDESLSFDAVHTLMMRACDTALTAYKNYCLINETTEAMDSYSDEEEDV